MPGFLANTSLQPFTRSITEETCGPFSMITSPLPPILSTMYWQAISPAWMLFGHHRGVRPLGRDVDRHDDDAGRLRPLDRRRDRLGVGGVEQDQVDARGDEIVDLGDLLVRGRSRPTPVTLTFGLIFLALASAPLTARRRTGCRASPGRCRSTSGPWPSDGARWRERQGGARKQDRLQHGFLPGPCLMPGAADQLPRPESASAPGRLCARPLRCGRSPAAGSGRAPPRR